MKQEDFIKFALTKMATAEEFLEDNEADLIAEQVLEDAERNYIRFELTAVLQGQDAARAWLKENTGPPKCPHCGSTAPYGYARDAWLDLHLENRFHRWLSKVRKNVKR